MGEEGGGKRGSSRQVPAGWRKAPGWVRAAVPRAACLGQLRPQARLQGFVLVSVQFYIEVPHGKKKKKRKGSQGETHPP